MSNTRKLSLRPAVAAMLLGATANAGATFASPEAGNAELLTAPVAGTVTRAGSHASLADMVERSVVQIQVKPDARFQKMSSPTSSMGGQEDLMQRFFGFRLPNSSLPRAAR